MELILNTFGVSLNRDNEGFVITSKDGRQRIPADGITSIQISRGAQITSDAVMLAVEREIEVMFMDRSGNPMGRVWSPRYGSISTFLANLDIAKYEAIKADLSEVQSLYENHDSIIVCPISSDLLRSMRVIGQNINMDIITQSKNTLFF